MPKIIVNTSSLLKEIESVFTFVDMPYGNDLVFHKNGCFACNGLQNDSEDYRDKEITGELIRLVYQELSSLSAKGWRWILPYYLRYCLTSDAEYHYMETEFLIYNLRPSLEFQKDTVARLSLLNKDHINCLIHFLMWCEDQQCWRDYCLDDIKMAKSFLSSIK